jgi:hypothetical protein
VKKFALFPLSFPIQCYLPGGVIVTVWRAREGVAIREPGWLLARLSVGVALAPVLRPFLEGLVSCLLEGRGFDQFHSGLNVRSTFKSTLVTAKKDAAPRVINTCTCASLWGRMQEHVSGTMHYVTRTSILSLSQSTRQAHVPQELGRAVDNCHFLPYIKTSSMDWRCTKTMIALLALANLAVTVVFAQDLNNIQHHFGKQLSSDCSDSPPSCSAGPPPSNPCCYETAVRQVGYCMSSRTLTYVLGAA